MDKPQKLGRLVVKQRRQELRSRTQVAKQPAELAHSRRHQSLMVFKLVAGLMLTIALAVATGMLWGSGWLPAQFTPRRLVVRGCVLTNPGDLLARLDCTSETSYATLLRSTRSLDTAPERWLRGVALKPVLPRAAMLTVHERQPVLRAVVGGAKYWLCSDGSLAAMNIKKDHGSAYDRIRQLPSIELCAGVDNSIPDTQALLIAAALCERTVPGLIDRISVGADGLLDLYDRKGLRIHLGHPEDLEQKIAALPQTLRICAADRERLKYLDASNPSLFYQVWKEPQAAASTAGNV